jgi:hypothetical protein
MTLQARRVAEEIGPSRVPPRQGFNCQSLEIAWRKLTDACSQSAYLWWTNEFAASGIRLCSPYLDHRLFDFVFSTPPRLRPRSYDTRQFKPLIARGLRDYIPEQFHFRLDKVTFDSYDTLLFDLTLDCLCRYFFDAGEWHSEAYVTQAQAKALFEAYRRKLGDGHCESLPSVRQMRLLQRVAGLELWLRERHSTQYPEPLPQDVTHEPQPFGTAPFSS